jgi:hypothetical protein
MKKVYIWGIMKKLPSIDSEEFLPYLQEKASNHHSYKMYNQIDVVNSTIDNKALYLSTGNDWNDVVDRNNFNNDKLTMLNFGRCFSYSTTESVAMWMLYGGMKHKGAMIDFDKSSISEILRNTKQIRVGFFENEEFHSLKELTKQEFEIELIDVVYVEKKILMLSSEELRMMYGNLLISKILRREFRIMRNIHSYIKARHGTMNKNVV